MFFYSQTRKKEKKRKEQLLIVVLNKEISTIEERLYRYRGKMITNFQDKNVVDRERWSMVGETAHMRIFSKENKTDSLLSIYMQMSSRTTEHVHSKTPLNVGGQL